MENNKIKLFKMFNEIFNNQINKYLILSKNIDDCIPRESIIILEAANKSIENSLKLLNEDEYVDSLCLLRSSFEAILFSLAIFFDKETYEAYKFFDMDTYYKYLAKKNKDYVKKKRGYLKPGKMRFIVSKNYKEISNNFFYDCNNWKEVNAELKEFYTYLCNFTHPSIVKIYTYKLQNDFDNLNSIRVIFKLNINYCKMLLIITLNYFTLKGDLSDIYDLYAFLFLSDINLIDDVDNMKKLLKKYESYLYLDTLRKYIRNNDKQIKEMQNEIKRINEIENMNNLLVEKMKNIIVKFDSEEIFKKIFN